MSNRVAAADGSGEKGRVVSDGGGDFTSGGGTWPKQNVKLQKTTLATNISRGVKFT
jgi:hypothetical protein